MLNSETKHYKATCPFCGELVEMEEEMDHKTRHLNKCKHLNGVIFKDGEYTARFIAIKDIELRKIEEE